MAFPKKLFLSLALCAPVWAQPLLSEPALSPDHTEIAFVSGGDIWTVPATGGEARLLISNPATESHPVYSPDGTRLAFVSTRTGGGDIYVLHLRTGELKRITFDDLPCALSAWSPDGKSLYFASGRADIAGMSDIFRVSADGGTPVAVAADRFADESQAAPNPRDGTIAIVSGGMAVRQWWRKGHAHIDETRMAIVSIGTATMGTATPGQKPAYRQILADHGKNLWPMWSADGKTLYFMSDSSGTENIWRMTPGTSPGAPHQVTSFTDGRVLFPAISQDGRSIVFERDFAIWKMDSSGEHCAKVEVTLRGVPAGPTTSHLSLTTDLRDLALSGDGKKIAFIAHGEVFAAGAKEGGGGVRLTQTAANEKDIAWALDSTRLLYSSDRGGQEHLYIYDLAKETETPLTSGYSRDQGGTWSPDGKQIAYIRDGRELHVIRVDSKVDRVLVTRKLRTLLGFGQTLLSWSPDGQFVAFCDHDNRGFSNVYVVPEAGGSPEKAISFIANSSSGTILWSPDRKYLLFNTAQRTEPGAVARVDLVARTPRFRETDFRDLFREETPSRPAPQTPPPANAPVPAPAVPQTPAGLVASGAKPKAPVEIQFDGIRQRLALLPLGLDTQLQAISPDGKTLLFTADTGRQQNLYTFSLDELVREPPVPRQLTSTAGRKSRAQFSPDGKEVFFLENGKIAVIPVDTRIVRPLAVTAELDIDFSGETKEVFYQAWSTINETYYDPKFHGTNWADMRGKYERIVDRARTPDEARRVISLMIGELNSSHSGISGGLGAAAPAATGRLGLTVDPSDGSITEVSPLGPADVAGIRTGEKLLAVDGKPFDASSNLDQMLQYRIGKRTLLTTSAKKDIPVLPINTTTEKRLLYKQWVEERRAYVHKVSNGRLGYVHMPDMSADSLDQLYIDLDAENHSREGVVVDIRNNNGGFVNAYALDVFARRSYLTMTTRDRPATPARSQLGQRSLELPTVLVVNQDSLSDAEDFTEGYRTLKLGKVVGVPTAGWIIYTGSAQLIDGSALRTPGTKITANDGTDMELHPRPVDVTVDRPMGESYTGRDAQLDAAVKTLLGEIGGPRPSK